MSNPVKKTNLDTAVEDLAGEMRTTLLQTSVGGEVGELEKALGHVMSAVMGVQDAIGASDDDTYPGWLATDTDPPPAHS